MMYLDKIPHLKCYLQKVYLPVNKDEPLKGSIVFLNTKSIDGSINAINNRFIYHNNKYKHYYIDMIYKGKIINKNYRIILRKKRLEEYKLLEDKLSNIRCVKELTTLKGRNVYVDLRVYNDIFFKYIKGRHFKIIIENYIRYIKTLIADNVRFPDFSNRVMYIDAKEWIKDIDNLSNRKMSIDNPIFMLFYLAKYNLDLLKELGSINIIIVNGNKSLRLNPSECDEKSWTLLRVGLNKLAKGLIPETDDQESALVDAENLKSEIREKLKSDVMYLTGTKIVPDESKSHMEPINKDVKMPETVLSPEEEFVDTVVNKAIDSVDPSDLNTSSIEDIAISIKYNRQFISQIYDYNKIKDETDTKSRDKKLREEVKNLKMNNMSVGDLYSLAKKASNAKLEAKDISNKIHTPNKNMATVKFPDFDKKYIEEVMHKDYLEIFRALEDRSIGMTIIGIDVKDSSDRFNYKETWTIKLEDRNRVRHSVTVDIPKIVDNRFIYLAGNKKVLYKQKFPYPIIKIGPDKVQICTNYNKIFLERYGQRVTEEIEKFNTFIIKAPRSVEIVRGDNTSFNTKYITTFEYDELAKKITHMKIKNYKFFFNIEEFIKEYPEVESILKKDKYIPIGYSLKDKEFINVNLDTQLVDKTDKSIIEYIISLLSPEEVNIYDTASSGTKFMYSRATLMKKDIPVILILAYVESLSGILKKSGIKFRFSDKRSNIGTKERVLRFNDGYLIYTVDTFETALLMNGLSVVPTRSYNYEDFDNKDTYLDIFQALYGTRILGNAIDNFYDSLIDPKTKEILEYLDYPTDFTNVILFANKLLSDNNHLPEDSMEQYRIRSFEMLPGMLYKGIADAYGTYRITANNNNPIKMSVPKNYLIKKILTSQVVEDYSEINPITELEKDRTITPKGHSGLNLDRAYTLDKRGFSPSMKGIYAMSTSPDGNVGVSRVLSLEPNIKNIYGMLDLEKDDDKLKDVNLFSPGELLSPLGASSDDPIRSAMALKQSKHLIAVSKASPVLISNGVEETIPYHLSKDFVIIAQDDGKVVEVKDDIAILKYNNGNTEAIDLRPRIVKNSGGGFFLSNKYTLNFKLGDKFKKDDIVAKDSSFFSSSKYNGTRFNIGSLQKIAILPTNMTIEDSTEITLDMAKDMMSEIVVRIPLTVSMNANIDKMCKVGQEVKTGETIVEFNASNIDADMSKMLANVSEELQEEVLALSKNTIKAKVSGVVENITISPTVEIEELSPTLQKIVKDYFNENKKFQNVINKHVDIKEKNNIYKAGMLQTDVIDEVVATDNGKLKGEIVNDGVLIEIYIKFKDYLGIGDKGAFFTALKFVNGDVISDGYEPYTPDRPKEKISSFVSTNAIIARKTPSITKTLAANKAIIELKRKLWEIYYEKDWNDR